MCAFLTLIFFGPRVATVLWWLFQPVRFDLVFSGIVLPILGIIFVPWTTLMYVIVAPGGLLGWDWFWIILALIIDLGSYAGGYAKKDKLKKSNEASNSTPQAPQAPQAPQNPPANPNAGPGPGTVQ